MHSEEQWSSLCAFQSIGIDVEICEMFGLQKCVSKCLLIAQILNCKTTDLTLPPVAMMHSA